MADMAATLGTVVYDECDEYDKRHGRSTLADEQRPTGLSEAGNQPSPEHVSFRITLSQ